MSMNDRNRARQAGRTMEGKLVFAIIVGIAISVAVGTVTEIILPAFEQVSAALEAARPAR